MGLLLALKPVFERKINSPQLIWRPVFKCTDAGKSEKLTGDVL
jgi:hypothetical protein